MISQTYNAGMTQVTLQIATTRPSRQYRIQSRTTLLSTGPGAWTDVGVINPFKADAGTSTTKVITFADTTARSIRTAAERPLQ